MLHVYFGNDTISVRKKAFAFITACEEDGFGVERIEAESYQSGQCANIAGSLSLFGGKTVYLLDTPSNNNLFLEELESVLPLLKESSDQFVVLEGTLLAPAKKMYGKYADKLEETTGEKVERFNAFSLADSLALKDKKMLWIGLQDAKREGLSSEEIIGTLWWQLKTLRLANVTASAVQAGMKDFPYNKAKRSLRNFKEGELEKFSQTLLAVYHDGHAGKRDIDLALEKWTLTI
jgi:DNA polymerase III delta subunit